MVAARWNQALWTYEVRPFMLAFALLARGFRTPHVPGWSYDRGGMTSTTLIALALLTVPQALVFHLLFSHVMVLQLASAVVHIDAIAWSLAAATSLRVEPHVIDDGRATFRFPLLQSIEIPLADITSVRSVDRRPRGVPRFGLGKVGLLIHLRAPVRITRPVLQRSVSEIFVAADNLHTLERVIRGRNGPSHPSLA